MNSMRMESSHRAHTVKDGHFYAFPLAWPRLAIYATHRCTALTLFLDLIR